MLELTATQEEYNDIIELYLADYLHATQAQNLLATKPEQYNFFGINDNFKSKTWDAMDDVEFITVFDNLLNSKVDFSTSRIMIYELVSEKTEEVINALQTIDEKWSNSLEKLDNDC